MAVQILLLRGINVGGHGKLPMAELRDLLAALGARKVQTCIQSGNAVFIGALDAAMIEDAIEAAKGFRPRAMLFDRPGFIAIADAAPHADKAQHVWFTETPADFDFTTAQTLRKESETLTVGTRAVYLHAPDGIGRSKLAAKIEKLAGVPCTARNWNTISKLRDLAATYE